MDKYAHVATMQEIAANGFNLNIPRYVDTFEPEEEIDLNQVCLLYTSVPIRHMRYVG